MVREFPAGRLDNIRYVAIFTRYRGRWVYAFHRRRGSYEHPGGHVERGETALEAARRELYEETGIKEATLTPMWDYEYTSGRSKYRNNGRVFFAEASSVGELPECSEMTHIEFFDDVPDNFTYDPAKERRDIRVIMRALPVVLGEK